MALSSCNGYTLTEITEALIMATIWAASCEKGPDDMTRDFE